MAHVPHRLDNFVCIKGTTVLLSVTVTGLPAAARVLHIVLKTPDGAILKVLSVKDNYSDASRVLYAEYNVTSEVNTCISLSISENHIL